MRRWGSIALVVTAALVLGAFGIRAQLHAPVVHAAQTWGVQVGGEPGPGLTSVNFYPRAITINAGDAVSFTIPSQEPHTVTFDNGNVPGLFLTGLTPDSPNPGDVNLSKAFLPVNAPGGSATVDGSQVVSSGVPTDAPADRMPFNVSFPKAGVYYFECTVHGPLMSGTVTVQPSGSALVETPAQAKARGDAEAAQDLTNTQAASQAFAFTPTTTVDDSGATHHTLSAGAAGFHIADLAYSPANYTVKRGDYITWSQPDPNEFHTVTFLSGANEPPFVQVIPQPGGPPQIVIPAATNAPAGGNTYTGSGVVNSGTITPGNTFTLKIDAPPGTYQYVCLYHADDYNMKGTITVAP